MVSNATTVSGTTFFNTNQKYSAGTGPCGTVTPTATRTNTPPTTPYRSAGRPEVIFVLERLIDLAALYHGFDRVELRRRNLIP